MIEDERLALLTGFVIGTMMNAGLDVKPEVDDDGDYVASILLTLPELHGLKIRLKVERA